MQANETTISIQKARATLADISLATEYLRFTPSVSLPDYIERMKEDQRGEEAATA